MTFAYKYSCVLQPASVHCCYDYTSHTVISGSDSLCICATVPDCCLHSCTCYTLILAVYEFACLPLPACDIFM